MRITQSQDRICYIIAGAHAHQMVTGQLSALPWHCRPPRGSGSHVGPSSDDIRRRAAALTYPPPSHAPHWSWAAGNTWASAVV